MSHVVDVETRDLPDGETTPCLLFEEVNDGETPLPIMDAMKLAVLMRDDLDAYDLIMSMVEAFLERGFTAGFEA